MKKRLLCILCMLSMMLTFASCGQSDGADTAEGSDGASGSQSADGDPSADSSESTADDTGKNKDDNKNGDASDSSGEAAETSAPAESAPADTIVEAVESALSDINGALDVISRENDGNPEVDGAIITIRQSSNYLAGSYLDSEGLDKPTPAIITGRILLALYDTDTYYGSWLMKNIDKGTIRFGFYDMTGDGIPELFVETSDAICSILNVVDISNGGFDLLAQLISPEMSKSDEIDVTWYTGNRGYFYVSNKNRSGNISEVKVIIEPTESGKVNSYWYSTSDNNLGNADKKLAEYSVIGKGMKTTRIFAASELNYQDLKEEVEKNFEITEPAPPAETKVTDENGDPVETETAAE